MKKTAFMLILVSCVTSCSRNLERSEIVGKVRELAALATLEITFKKIVFAEKSKKLLFVPFGNAYYYMTIHPRIKTGIDLSKIADKDINIDAKANSITITLPPVEVLVFDYPMDTGIVNNELSRSSLANKIKIAEIEAIHRAAENEVRKQINFMGIREMTENRTRLFLERSLQKMGYEQVKITYSSAPSYLLYFKEYSEKDWENYFEASNETKGKKNGKKE